MKESGNIKIMREDMILIKRVFICFFLFLLSGVFFLCSADDSNLVITTEKDDNGKKFIMAEFTLKADPELVYHLFRDVKKFSEFMPGSADVDILEKGTGYQVVKFSGSRGLLSGDIVMRRNIDDSSKKIGWSLVKGAPREVCGFWQVEKDKKRESFSIVHYTNYVDAGALIPGILVRKYLREDVKKMVPNIIKRVESDGTWVSEEYKKKMTGRKKEGL